MSNRNNEVSSGSGVSEQQSPMNSICRGVLNAAVCIALFVGTTAVGLAEDIHKITIDGNFSDWASVPSHFDPAGGPGVLHNGIPDTHDTDHSLPNDVPVYVNHPDIDLLEFKFTHDVSNLYAYFRATGLIGNTIAMPQSTGVTTSSSPSTWTTARTPVTDCTRADTIPLVTVTI